MFELGVYFKVTLAVVLSPYHETLCWKYTAVGCCCFRREDASILSSLQASNLSRPCRHDTTLFLVSRAFQAYTTAVYSAVRVRCRAGDTCRHIWTPLMTRWMLTVCRLACPRRWQPRRQQLTANLTWTTTLRAFSMLRQQTRRLALHPVSLACCSCFCFVGITVLTSLFAVDNLVTRSLLCGYCGVITILSLWS